MLRKELELERAHKVFWTDSRVVLGYVNNNARRFHIFVANCIQRIKESTSPSQWRHLASEENPADHASRGLKAKELIVSNWFTGPNFLWCDELPSRDIKVGDITVEDPEVCKAFEYKTSTTKDSLLDRLLKFSSWTRLVQAIDRFVRWVKECKGLVSRTTEATSLTERKEAELTIIGIVQQAAFPEEIQNLQCKKGITAMNKTSKLHRLNPFLDERGSLRVGGRLEHAALHPHIKHPAILPKASHISTFNHCHELVQHQGSWHNNECSAIKWTVGCNQASERFFQTEDARF